ncbi:MAG TPA: methyltransferase domain-containing protein [Candidatus Sulfotelmatobacter sp.]|nr:methyltransferase domain-containing protein [Candidatus Sulfotelmatobacter sp.]
MAEVNLLAALPKGKRNLNARSTKTDEHVRVSREYGQAYFDGPREYGYGGYRYDGRWIPVARDMIAHFGLKPGDRVLDVGCAKGFLVKDLMQVCPGLEAFGIDVSRYALDHCERDVVGRLHLGSADDLPFPDGSFQAVISLNTVHNLERLDCIRALREMQRLAPGKGFVQVDSYRTPEQRAVFVDWVLTAKYHDYPDGWIKTFQEAGYTGDYYWTIIE